MNRRDFLRTSVLGGVALGVSPLGAASPRRIKLNDSFDLILKNGVIYDGSLRPAVRGDVAVKAGKVAAIGSDLGAGASRVIDLGGLTVSPGFIDIHSHTDTNLFQCPEGDSRIRQGVTLDVGGNCGGAPFVFSDEEWAKRKGTKRFGYPAWRDVDGFYEALEQNKIGINYCSLVGHGDLREAVVGPYNVKATDEQLEKMCAILDRQLSLGAIGLSFGLEYTPGCYCDTREMVALCKVVARHDALYSIHMRNEDDHVLEAMDEAIEAARLSGARLEISHLKAQNPANFDKIDAMLAKVDAARAEGIDIAFDRYPYTAFYTGMSNFIPTSLRDGTKAEVLARLDDPEACKKMRESLYRKLDSYGGADKVLVCACKHPDNQVYAGKNLSECSRISGLDEWEFVRYILKTEKLSVYRATFAMREENLHKLYAHPLGMPGSDGGVTSPTGPLSKMLPHPRYYGTFPRFFEKYVRETPVLDISTAIYKCTALPASRLGLKDRGQLIPGYAADITVFNPETIADLSTYAAPHAFPRGIEYVVVNGKVCVERGEHTGALPGEIVRL